MSQSFAGGSADDTAAPACLTQELENYLYVQGFTGDCSLGSLRVPPQNPLDPPGTTLDDLIVAWLGMDRRRYSTLPFFVRREKVEAAYHRELAALAAQLLPPYVTRQALEDMRALFELMDAYDRISGIQNRVRRILKQMVTQQLEP
ncbi:MAG: hypothetical protein Q6J68_05945 [Thermostichales cyanobacterium SZTDM-1c_bins_54]